MKFRSTALSLFIAFVVQNAIWISIAALFVSNDIPSFTGPFYLLMGIPFPLFLSFCVFNFKSFVKREEIPVRQKTFYTRLSKIFVCLIVLSLILTILCWYGA